MHCCRCGTEVSKIEAACLMLSLKYHLRSISPDKKEGCPLCAKCAIALDLFMSGNELVDEEFLVASMIESEG